MESFESKHARVQVALLRFRTALVGRKPFDPAIICTTGTRHGPTQAQMETWDHMRPSLSKIVMHNGCAIGWDRYAALSLPATKELWPSNSEQYLWAKDVLQESYVHALNPPLKRNQFMVESSHGVIAVPSTSFEGLRSGTWATIRHARKVKKPVLVIWPNGEIVFDGSLAPEPER